MRGRWVIPKLKTKSSVNCRKQCHNAYSQLKVCSWNNSICCWPRIRNVHKGTPGCQMLCWNLIVVFEKARCRECVDSHQFCYEGIMLTVRFNEAREGEKMRHFVQNVLCLLRLIFGRGIMCFHTLSAEGTFRRTFSKAHNIHLLVKSLWENLFLMIEEEE